MRPRVLPPASIYRAPTKCQALLAAGRAVNRQGFHSTELTEQAGRRALTRSRHTCAHTRPYKRGACWGEKIHGGLRVTSRGICAMWVSGRASPEDGPSAGLTEASADNGHDPSRNKRQHVMRQPLKAEPRLRARGAKGTMALASAQRGAGSARGTLAATLRVSLFVVPFRLLLLSHLTAPWPLPRRSELPHPPRPALLGISPAPCHAQIHSSSHQGRVGCFSQ